MKPMLWLQICPLSTTRGLPLPFPRITSGCMSQCRNAAPDTQTLRMCTSHDTFHRQLTTHYFQQAFQPTCASDSALADHCARLQIIFTYLLTYLLTCTNGCDQYKFHLAMPNAKCNNYIYVALWLSGFQSPLVRIQFILSLTNALANSDATKRYESCKVHHSHNHVTPYTTFLFQ